MDWIDMLEAFAATNTTALVVLCAALVIIAAVVAAITAHDAVERYLPPDDVADTYSAPAPLATDPVAHVEACGYGKHPQKD